ncbi:NADP-dependent oxidoreductase [Streptosporangium lutulentum]|uniref:Acetyl esterase n=1 Tax=Streptosporangium lutulentum TaxID=1461250 RepID=A0ABT9QSY7_9ACTN|nr:NADP-dependent oxidoreductase [Streptosporangium lutulentum]MDP9849796.1 acetyl esterase [Streptosporangium lutulentum]
MSRAIRYARYGGPEVLTLDEVPVPDPGPGEVRVAVRAAGVNGIDWKLRRGFLAGGRLLDGPVGTGVEFAGVVDALGAGVRDWNVGQAVFGHVPSGAVATHVRVAAEGLLAKPDRLSFEQAAALPVAAETAYRTLRQLDVKHGRTLLVHAVAGGVGLVAAQLARAWDAEVVGTAGAVHHDFLRELGVRPVTYGDGLAERVRAAAPEGVDAVLDASGRDVLALSVELTGDPEKVVTIADGRAAEHGVRFSTGADGVPLPEVFAEIFPLLEWGALRLPIERTFPLERAADAYRLSEEGHLLGKIVIVVA